MVIIAPADQELGIPATPPTSEFNQVCPRATCPNSCPRMKDSSSGSITFNKDEYSTTTLGEVKPKVYAFIERL